MTAAVGQEVRQLSLLCYYNYLIRIADNFMSVLLKRHSSKFIHLEALYHHAVIAYPLPSPAPQGYSGTSPLGHPYPRDSSIQEAQKLVT